MNATPQHQLPPVTLNQAYQAGFECGSGRARSRQCVFVYFNTLEIWGAFDRGHAAGLASITIENQPAAPSAPSAIPQHVAA